MSNVWAKTKHELRDALPPAIFFWVTFHIVLLDRALMLEEYGLRLSCWWPTCCPSSIAFPRSR